jgi:hypothetical protein
MRKAWLILTLLGVNSAFAQNSLYNPQNCHSANKTSIEKFVESLDLAATGISFWGEIAEDGHLSKLGAAMGFGVALYKYLQDRKPDSVCFGTAPDGKRIGLIGTSDVMLHPRSSLGLDYGKLTLDGRSLALAPLPLAGQTAPASPAVSQIDIRKMVSDFKIMQSLRSNVTGEVTYVLGKGFPVPGATVKVISLENPGVWVDLVTDAAGRFEADVLPGRYVVDVHNNGCQEETKPVTVNGSAGSELEIPLGCLPPRPKLFR